MRERRSQLITLAAVLAALLAVLAIIIPGSPVHKEPILGLDLQGGLEVVLEARPLKGEQLTEADLNRSADIIRERIDKFGVSEPEVRTLGEDQIGVQLAGVFDRQRATEIIGKTAQLELYDLQGNLVPGASLDLQQFPVAQTSVWNLLSSATVQTQAKVGEPNEFFLIETTKKGSRPQRKVVVGPVPTRAEIFSADYVKNKKLKKGELPKNTRIMAVPEKMVMVTCGAKARYCPGVRDTPERTYFYLFKFDPLNEEDPVPEMTGTDLELTGTRQDFDTQGSNEPIVLMQFTDRGGKKFHEITRRLVERGRVVHARIGGDDETAFQQFAIVLDREIRSAPSVSYIDNPDGIPGNNGAQITGIGSVSEAQDLALVLQTGALPVKFTIVDETNVSATLGKDSLRQALIASLAGLLLVALFLLIFYRFLGLVAVIGLGLYAAFMYAAILLLNVTLTLPGFAGMILAIGVAADANIVIFERIKEESASGKSVRAAVSSGYSKGFATIIDANVVTAITALILFLIATGGVRGFAALLLLGTLISILTAVFATRGLLGLLGGFKWFGNPRFMGASAQRIANWQRFDAVGRRRIWFTVAGVLIALSIASIALKGLNLGIDFRGGSQLSFATPRPVQIEDIRIETARVGNANAQIQGRGTEAANGGFREFQIKSKQLDRAELNRLNTALENEFGAESRGIRNVSASFSEQILRSAIIAVVFSFFLITLYVTFRFQWRFAVPILRTIVNDGLIAVGVYSFAGLEVSASTVAAFLTIIGYSIYDTIIIFDRVRENLPLMRRSTIAQIVNQSLWETVRRSLATTFIVLLPVTALYFFGGDTLKDFAFAILVGISISAFSTIFIAAPFLAVLLERSPDYKQRRAGLEDLPPDEGPEPDGGKPARRRPRTPIGGPAVDTGTMSLEEGTQDTGEPARGIPDGLVPDAAPAGSAKSKRERRRQRRRARPHGRR